MCQGHVGAGITCPCACSGKPQSLCFELLRPWGAPALEKLGMNPFAPVQRGTTSEKRQSCVYKLLCKAVIASH